MKKMILIRVLLVLSFAFALLACNSPQTESTPVPTVIPTAVTFPPCVFQHHGTTFTVPYTEVNEYDRFEVSRIPPTEYTYTYRNVEWKVGLTCHFSSNPKTTGPVTRVAFDMPVAPEGNITPFSCNNTEIVVSGKLAPINSCDPTGLIHITLAGDRGEGDTEELELKWNWVSNSSTDTYARPWKLEYRFVGNHTKFGESSNLECKWITWEDSNYDRNMNLAGKEVGYFDIYNKVVTDVICAGDGYTVKLTAK